MTYYKIPVEIPNRGGGGLFRKVEEIEILAQSNKLFLTNICHETIGIFQNQANSISNAL